MSNEQEHPWEAFSRWEQWLRDYLSPMECDEWLDDIGTAEMANLYAAFHVYQDQEIAQLRTRVEELEKERQKYYNEAATAFERLNRADIPKTVVDEARDVVNEYVHYDLGTEREVLFAQALLDAASKGLPKYEDREESRDQYPSEPPNPKS